MSSFFKFQESKFRISIFRCTTIFFFKCHEKKKEIGWERVGSQLVGWGVGGRVEENVFPSTLHHDSFTRYFSIGQTKEGKKKKETIPTLTNEDGISYVKVKPTKPR